MRKLIVSEFVTLDGVIDAPNTWSFQYGSPEQMQFKGEELFTCDALLLGRVTYEGFAAAWPTMPGTGEYGVRMNRIPKYVVSTTLERAEWENSHVIRGDLAAEVSALKAAPGQDIVVFGSGTLVQSLAKQKLVDEYRLLCYPLALGEGKRLFESGTSASLALVESRAFSSGVVLLRYQPADTEQ